MVTKHTRDLIVKILFDESDTTTVFVMDQNRQMVDSRVINRDDLVSLLETHDIQMSIHLNKLLTRFYPKDE